MQVLILVLVVAGYGLDWWETVNFYTGFRWSVVILLCAIGLLLMQIFAGR